MKVYQQCPRKYWYENIAKFPKGPRHPAALLGSSFHKAIEHWHKPAEGDTRSPVQFFDDHYRQACAKEGIEFDQLLWSDGVHMVINYEVRRQPIQMEREFKLAYPVDKPRYILHGYIDQLYDWGFVDLKTNKKRPTQKDLDEDLQFIIYAWAFEQIQGYPPLRSVWYQARTGKDIDADVVGKTSRIDAVMDAIDQSYFLDDYPRNESFLCRFCPFYDPCYGIIKDV